MSLPLRRRAANLLAVTYSVVALELESGTTGAAIASCIPLDTLRRVYGAVPERGALITQSYLHDTAHAEGLALLASGAKASEVVAELTSPAFDPEFSLRQYAAIDASAGSASFTGSGANAVAAHRSGSSERFVHLAQGNFLVDEAVLERMSSALGAPDACDLPDALVRALLKGGEGGAGDARCAAFGVPAQSALLVVGDPKSPILEIAIDGSDPPSSDPVAALAAEYQLWRTEHPCPEPAASRGTESAGCAIGGEPGAAGWMLLLSVCAVLLRRSLQ